MLIHLHQADIAAHSLSISVSTWISPLSQLYEPSTFNRYLSRYCRSKICIFIRSVHICFHLSFTSFETLEFDTLRGATTLKARLECKNKLNGSTPILQIEENNDFEFDFENCRSILAKGSELHIETLDGTFCEDFLYVGTLIEICYCNLSCIQKKNPFA
ncbi:unnamed protein product [Camellia sinensis]